jgi:glycosyltransferase involved in cell wall biosynthesis
VTLSTKIDVLTPTIRGFKPPILQPALDEIVCHWRTSNRRPLSFARRELLRESDTEWSLFIDDDVRWDTNSIVRLVGSTLGRDIGAVETQIFDDPQGPNSEQMHRGLHFSSDRVTRGWTGFTLVRSSECKKWNPPPINSYEDESLRRFLARKNLRWIRNMDISIMHQIRYHTPAQFYEDGVNASMVLSHKSILWSFVKYPLFLRHGKGRMGSYTQFLNGMISGLTRGTKASQSTS